LGTAAGTAISADRSPSMTDPKGADPAEQNRAERDLERRSSAPAVSPWLIIGLLLMLGAVVYVISATAMR
jgi:hypothetical protein